MCTEPTTEAVAAGRASGYGPQDWVALAASALREARNGMTDSALTGPGAIALVNGIQAVGERFPEVVSEVATALMSAARGADWVDEVDAAQFVGTSRALSGAAAGFSRGGGWLDYAHHTLTGFGTDQFTTPPPADTAGLGGAGQGRAA